jgi:predicted nucleic acid-binding protein
MGFLIDTSIWVDVERGAIAPADVAAITEDAPVYLSPVTIGELKFGAEIASSPIVTGER